MTRVLGNSSMAWPDNSASGFCRAFAQEMIFQPHAVSCGSICLFRASHSEFSGVAEDID